jgi:hypothetical protein
MSHDVPVPFAYWSQLSQDDRSEYLRLRTSFHDAQKVSSKDRGIVTFHGELTVVMQFQERRADRMEARCVVTGVCFAGPIVCVNTRQLRGLLKRCKSSINGSFQQLGYVTLRTKSKARTCLIAALPSLENEQAMLRRWTVRVASGEANFCFLSAYSRLPLPEITDDDLVDEKVLRRADPPAVAKQVVAPPQPRQVTFAVPPVPPVLKPRLLGADLTWFGERQPPVTATIAPSFSVASLRDVDQPWPEPEQPPADDPWRRAFEPFRMKKSKSVGFDVADDWDSFADGFR